MTYTYRLYTSKTIGIFENKDDAINLLFHIPNSRIEVFQHLTPIGIYTLKNNTLFLNDLQIELEGFMKKWYANEEELNLFIPLTQTEITPVNNLPNNPDELLKHIQQLEEATKLNENLINEYKNNVDDKKETFHNKKIMFDKEKKNLDKEKENWFQLKSKLEADKRVYFIIKEQLDAGELTEDSIPVLFQDKYPIFLYMDNNKLIYNDDTLFTEEINNYLMVLPKFKKENVAESESQLTTYNDLFSSSDPLYAHKKNTETSIN
jgi:hypothetical protein